MPLVDLICLANSNKMGGRCVAGLRVDGKGWVRPVAGETDHGQLHSKHYRLEEDTDPEILDVIRVDLATPKPLPGQPENWTIGERPWSLIARPLGRELYKILRSAIVPGPSLLGSTERRLQANALPRVKSSLVLVAASNLRWFVQRDLYDRLQPRVLFDLDGHPYDLPITDPAWTSRVVRRLSQMEMRTYSQETVGIPKEAKVFFTISLGEAFQGYCYKGIVISPGF